MAGPIMDAACLTYEGLALDPFETYMNLEKPVWILGKYFKPDQELKDVTKQILSILWFTYRKNFQAIGGTGPTSDTGWGCMLRCGQMMLAQCLICRHISRDWTWEPKVNDPDYMMVLRSFLDRKDSLYSIHQIAQMGVSEGKKIGQWFGPNTAAQVIRKLVMFDNWSDLAVYVSMDNTVVIEDIKKLCKSKYSSWSCYEPCTTSAVEDSSSSWDHRSRCDCGRDMSAVANRKTTEVGLKCSGSSAEVTRRQSSGTDWRPLLLFVPLRLGLSEVNSTYYPSLKVTFTMKQSLGFIGGKPNHAHYFVGFNGDTLLYLDPHTTQQTVDVDSYSRIPDESFHCMYPSFMNFAELDPSIALGFFCRSEEDFDEWCHAVQELIVDPERRPMFELASKRPRHWPPFEYPKRPCDSLDSAKSDFTELTYDYGEEDRVFDTDGEYEII